jgi:TusA-related sulfurtransferase
MASIHMLDLRGIISPLNLLKCKNRLASMAKGEVLEVLLTDTDVVEDLVLIVKKSNDVVIYKRKKADCICLGIKKGENLKYQNNIFQQEVL